MNSWQERATQFLQERLSKCEGVERSSPAAFPIQITPELADWEARLIILGLAQELFRIDDEGYVQSELLPQPPRAADRQKMINLFWRHRDRPRTLFREGVCQLATAARLILDRDMKPSQISMEPGIKQLSDLAYAIDILVRSKSGELVAGVEVKKNRREHDKLIEGFHYCCARGPHSKSDCSYKSNHAKYAFCASLRPKFFIATSPESETIYGLSHDSGFITLEAIPSFDHISSHF